MTCKFIEMLDAKQAEGKLVCVGLDSKYENIPAHLKKYFWTSKVAVISRFNRAIVDKTHDLVCCYKPNLAFYLEAGEAGITALRKTIAYVHDQYPLIPVILDCKVGDIGGTNEAYAVADFDDLDADAITINPYLSEEANRPFLERTNKGIIVICKTSNPGSDEFQNRPTFISYEELAKLTDGKPLPKGIEEQWTAHIVSYDKKPGYLVPFYQLVALRVSRKWNKHGNCALVVGATFIEELQSVRQFVGNEMYILGPGFGKQGAKPEETIPVGINDNGTGFIANSSSKIIFASKERDFAEAARCETLRFHNEITRIRIAMHQEKKP